MAWVTAQRPFAVPVTVLAELRFGALKSLDPVSKIAALEIFISRCTVLPSGPTTAAIYAEARLEIEKRGKPIPQNDIWIAAACIEHGLPLATKDSHFTQFPRLKTIVPY